MFWRILPHVTARIASNRVVLLDIRQDRYFLAPQAVDKAMKAWFQATSAGPPAIVMTMFERSRITRSGEQPSCTVVDVPATPQTLVPPGWGSANVTSTDRLRVAAIVTKTWLELRLQPLQRTLNRRARRGAETGVDEPETVIARASAYDVARRASPFARNCLLDSLSLHAWLARINRDCRLVFGVTAQPFSAHCWLQTPDAILNDSYDRVSRYAPILAL